MRVIAPGEPVAVEHRCVRLDLNRIHAEHPVERVVADRMHTKTDRMAVQQHPVPVSADFEEAEPERL